MPNACVRSVAVVVVVLFMKMVVVHVDHILDDIQNLVLDSNPHFPADNVLCMVRQDCYHRADKMALDAAIYNDCLDSPSAADI